MPELNWALNHRRLARGSDGDYLDEIQVTVNERPVLGFINRGEGFIVDRYWMNPISSGGPWPDREFRLFQTIEDPEATEAYCLKVEPLGEEDL